MNHRLHSKQHWQNLDLLDELGRQRAALDRWKAWEHAWIFGSDAEWPGNPGTADPRNQSEEMAQIIASQRADLRACAVVVKMYLEIVQGDYTEREMWERLDALANAALVLPGVQAVLKEEKDG